MSKKEKSFLKSAGLCFILFLCCTCSNSELDTTEEFSTDAISSLENTIIPIEEEISPTSASTDSSQIKKDSSSAKKDTTDAKKKSPIVKKDSTNVKKDSTNVKKDSANVKTDSSNVKKDSANVKTDSTNINKDSVNVKTDSTNVKKDSSNTKKDSTIKMDSTNATTARITSAQLLPDAGFKEPFTLSPPVGLGIVRCTFDGSEPDSTTPAFSEARSIDSSTVVRCTEFVNGTVLRKQSETYFIDEQIDMPVVSISVAPVYVQEYLDASPCQPEPCYGAKFWEDVEYPTHVEYFPEGSSTKKKAFEIDAGLSISGNYSRNLIKKTVTVKMRKAYQSGRIDYPFFEARPEKSKFKSFILRNNGNRFISDYIGDAMATSLLEGTNVDYQRSRQVVVFYNGEYRGIYDLREKLNEHFIETNYGIDNDNVDLLELSNDEIEVKNGSSNDYLNTLIYIDATDFIDNQAAYESVSQKIDIVSYMEYMAAEIFYFNNDWPQNNVRAWKSGNSPWRFIAYDIDLGFDFLPKLTGFTQTSNMITWILSGGRTDRPCYGGNNYRCFGNIFIKLIQNSDFKHSFINRASYLYSTFINGEKVAKQIDHINKSIDPAQIARDLALYKRNSYRNSCGTGFETDGSCLKTWSYNRDKTVRNDFKEAFELNDEVPITIEVKGNGILKLDDFDIKQSQEYNWIVFEHHPMKLSVECPNGPTSVVWDDGSTDPNRVIDPIQNTVYTAECQ